MALGQLSFPTAKAHSVAPEIAQTSRGFASDRDGFGRADRDGWCSRLPGPMSGINRSGRLPPVTPLPLAATSRGSPEVVTHRLPDVGDRSKCPRTARTPSAPFPVCLTDTGPLG